MMRKCILGFIPFLLVTAAFADSVTIGNPSFEEVTINESSDPITYPFPAYNLWYAQTGFYGTTISGDPTWVFGPLVDYTGFSGLAANGSAFDPATPYGSQVGFLQGGGGYFEQTLAGLTVGQEIQFTFWARARDSVDQVGGDLNIGLSFGSFSDVFSPTNTGGLITTPWIPITSDNLLRFTGLYPAGITGDQSAFVDSVSAETRSIAPVPEPTSLLLLGTGLGVLGLAAWRRRK